MQTTSTIFAIVLLLSPIALVVFIVLWRRAKNSLSQAKSELEDSQLVADLRVSEAERAGNAKVEAINARFSTVTDLDVERERVMMQLDADRSIIDELRADYAEKKTTFDALVHEIAIYDERMSFAEMGVYEPHFDFKDSESFKIAIARCRDGQKSLIKRKAAVVCATNWQVDGSSAKGQTFSNRIIRLTLRAFNNECDAAISNARWNNVNAMEKRIMRGAEQIDRLNESSSVRITEEFLQSKLEELYLTHEWREKQKAEREERAELARAAREEQKLLKDLEDAERDEARYQRLLAEAKAEADTAIGPKLEAFTAQIELLEADLADAHARAERAQAMAERTKSGYIYIISNIGSFGEGIVKIGLTRRLDPIDRVRELGDASVPFIFDIHAIIYSNDAPALERSLHQRFAEVRINSQNFRKEFFRASLEEVEEALAILAPEASFFKDIEAQEYRETVKKREYTLTMPVQNTFPNEL